MTQSFCTNLIERYLSDSGLPFLRGDHDGEYFCVVNAHPRRLRVHLAACPSFGDVLKVSVTPGRFFSVADRRWLTQLADTWNRRNRGVTAIVHGSSAPQRIGISATRSQWIRDDISLEDFACFIDSTIAAAIDLFAELTTVVELPPAAPSSLREVG
jgi:hypothetical protein